MTKQEIRKKYLDLRRLLTTTEVQEFNQKICNQFFNSIDLGKVNVIHTFLPIVSKNEVNTWLIIEKIKRDYPQIKISIPKVEREQLTNFYYTDKNQLETNQWGILEPSSGETTPIEKIDLIIVPLLAFDKKGNRVGYGKGFYDKFLSECRSHCKKIGLSFFEPTEELISVDHFDVPLDAAITPSQAINFKS